MLFPRYKFDVNTKDITLWLQFQFDCNSTISKRPYSGLGHKTPLAKYLYRKKSWGGVLSKFGSKSSQISWGSQKNQIWSDRSGKRWRDNDRREKVPFQALIIKEIWEKCPKMRFLLFLTRFIKLYEKLTYFIL